MSDRSTRGVPQGRGELEEHLREQVGFLFASIQRFDDGETSEAKRLAVHMRTLLHDGHGKSLFTLLGLKRGKRKILFYDTVRDLTHPDLIHGFGLVGLTLGIGPSGPRAFWSPALDPNNPVVEATRRDWQDWWSRWVLRDSLRSGFCRRDIVLPVAQQDGGAHVDPALDRRYAELSRLNTMRWLTGVPGQEFRPMPGIELHAVRTIAHELLVSLACQLPSSFADQAVRMTYARRTFTTEGPRVKEAGERPPFDQLRYVRHPQTRNS